MGLVNGVVYCILLCWALRFLGLVIGRDTLEEYHPRQILHLHRFHHQRRGNMNKLSIHAAWC